MLRIGRFAFVLLSLVARPSAAWASLGGTVSTVDADRVRVEGALMRIVRNNTYTLHEIRSASGTMIREYVDPSGTVFAVAWDGPWLPDLRQVLGEHFDHYQTAMRVRQQSRTGRGVVTIDDGGLVVQMSGHPRAFTGRAYLSSRLPAGVQLDSIR
jgi:NDP-sugar pyrophosphorylase family protein